MEEATNEQEALKVTLETIMKAIPEEEREEIRKAVELNLEAIREAMQHITMDLGRANGEVILTRYINNLIRKS